MRHPTRPVPRDVEDWVNFHGKVHVFHSAITRLYAPSDLWDVPSAHSPSWYSQPQHEDEDQLVMQGMLIARIHLLFSFTDYKMNDGELI